MCQFERWTLDEIRDTNYEIRITRNIIMKNKITIALCALFIGLSISSCSRKISFNTEVRNRVAATNTPLTKLQYYVDRTVELKRVITTGDTKVSSGTIKVENGKSIQIIKLKRNTPGVCTVIGGDRVSIAFEDGANKNLVFAMPRNATVKNSYVLQLTSLDKNGVGTVTYDGLTYTVSPSGIYAKLKVKKSVATKMNVKKTKMKGRKL